MLPARELLLDLSMSADQYDPDALDDDNEQEDDRLVSSRRQLSLNAVHSPCPAVC